MTILPQASLAVVAEFPEHYFLENLAVCRDGSILVSALNKNELWYVPTPHDRMPVKPLLLFTFDMPVLPIVEIEQDVFVIGIADVYQTREAQLHRLDLRGWIAGTEVKPQRLLTFPEPKVGLNGACLIAPDVLLVAGAANLIWRVDLPVAGAAASARIWLTHDNMRNRPGEMKPEQPGVNGIRYAAKTQHLYYTSTSQQLMMRVKLDPATLEPAGLPEFVAGGRQWDDFILDEDRGVAYVTTHRENTIDRVVLAPEGNREGRHAIAGHQFTDLLVGPSSGAWGRSQGDYGRIAYFTTDGGTASSPDGKIRIAKLLQVDFPSGL